jgi:soluble P-type ATPase
MAKNGIAIDIPGFGSRQIYTMLTDYTGTLARSGRLEVAVREHLARLSESLDIHVITSDTFGLAEGELQGLSVNCQRLEGERHDLRKEEYGKRFGLQHCVVLGNGNNDRLLLKAAKEAGGLAIAVDNGEGCATEALLNANLFIVGAVNALALLLEPRACKASLRF